jgi:glycosyltransferase involved in cell wall biosynthesis
MRVGEQAAATQERHREATLSQTGARRVAHRHRPDHAASSSSRSNRSVTTDLKLVARSFPLPRRRARVATAQRSRYFRTMLLVDATTAQHTRGIGTVIAGVVHQLPEVAPNETVVATGPDFEAVHGLRLRRVGFARTRPGRLLYQRLLLPLDVARMRARGERVDRVLLLDSYVPLVRPQRAVRYAAFVHDLLPLTHPHFWPAAKLVVKRAAFAALRRSRANVFTSSDYNARQIQRLLGLNARPIRYGCGQLLDAEADDAQRSQLPEREPYLIVVGALEPRKNVLSLLDVFELTARSLDSDVDLVIVGDGPRSYRSIVEERITRSRYRQRIQLISDADRGTALRLVQHASALLFPSLAEGFGLPILEALAVGTPVVASDVPEIRAWAGDAVMYAPPAQAEAWVQPVAAALAADATRRRSGQAFAAGFRWRHCAQELTNF